MNNSTGAWITRNKNRLKSYDEIVYLNKDDNFEIELFNDRSTEILARIEINGEHLSEAGLVLMPGQRFFLDRFLKTNAKFKFDVYQVEDSEEVEKAIQNNGNVKISYYEKTVTFPKWNYPTYPYNHWWNNPSTTPGYTPTWTTLTSTNSGDSDISFNTTNFSSTKNTLSSNNFQKNNSETEDKENNQETGRVSKGEKSNQSFSEIEMEFSNFPFKTIDWKILPISKKPIEVSKIRNYCTECGTRIKKDSWKFCPTCGETL